MPAYYNEHDPKAAAWLRELIRRNLIAPGEVDERSIVDVRGSDLRGFAQCHFFAGIGVWSYALRLAGWSDEREVWTGSCPCQPFSAAGKGEGYNDERHLWPHWHRLISECRPATIFGEQVAAAIRTGWLDDVCLSLESLGYAVGAVDFPACSVGAPHIRQRIYFVAESVRAAGERRAGSILAAQAECGSAGQFDGDMPDGLSDGSETLAVADAADERHGNERDSARRDGQPISRGGMGDAERAGLEGYGRPVGQHDPQGREDARRHGAAPGATNGFWRDAEWIACCDGKARPVEPGTFPLVDGAPARVVRLRGYGNAINAEHACAFIGAYIDR